MHGVTLTAKTEVRQIDRFGRGVIDEWAVCRYADLCQVIANLHSGRRRHAREAPTCATQPRLGAWP